MSKNAIERAAQKRGIMCAAWEIVRRTRKTISDALKAAWRCFWLKALDAQGYRTFDRANILAVF